MASILRGFRYPFGYFASFARSLALNNGGGTRQIDGVALVQPTPCLCGVNMNAFATASRASNESLERSLKRLDQDVKRMGRISRRDIEDVLEEIKSNQSATSSQSLLVIRCCGNLVPEEAPEVRTALVLEIWNTLNNLKIPMDISHYNALLRVYLENEHEFSPSEFLADLESKGIEPNRVTYQRLISRYCQKGDIEGATKILEFMREKQLPVNENVFNALIMGHSQAGDMESAAGILAVMKQAGLSPSSDTYTTLLCGYAKDGNIEAITATLDTCDKGDIFLLDKDILEVVYNLAINGHADLVDSLITRIRKSAGYNQDAINTILRLVNKGHEDTALKILLTMPRSVRQDGEFSDTGTFLIKQMIRCGRPLEAVVKVCRYLKANELNSRALLIAVEAAITSGSEATPELLKEIQTAGHPVRQHFFWPLICSAKDKEGVLNVVKMMQNDFNITPNSETLRDYIIPNMNEKNYDKVITDLRGVGISMSSCATATVYQALVDQNLSEAARIVSTYRVYYSPFLFRRGLLSAFNKTNDLDSYILFVRHLHDNLSRLDNIQKQEVEEVVGEASAEEELAASSANKAEILGQIIYDAVTYFKANRAQMVHQILNELVKQGLSVSNSQATRIQEKLGAELTPEISEMLGKLSTGELDPIPIERPDRPRMSLQDMDSGRLENLIVTVEAKGDSANGIKRQLISALVREKNTTKLEALIEKLKTEGYVISNGVFAQVADLYAMQGDLEKAVNTIKKVRETEPDFALDRLKVIRIAQLFIDQDRLEDGLKFLEENKKSDVDFEGFNYNTTCWRLLNSLADKGQTQALQTLFDKLIEFKYFEPNNVLLGPLIKVHLVKDDISEAMNTFEKIVEKYRATPWKNELACRLIQKEDPTNLQKLTDLSASVHGEVNSLYDLVFSFVECGRIRQARKILETPGLRTRPQRINIACERYSQEGMIQPLEGLVEATRDLNHIDRMEIYYNLLLSYIKDKQPEKALGLWTKLQEEDIAPTDSFLTKLSTFLKANNLEVPFVIPESAAPSPPASKPEVTKTKRDETPKQKPKPVSGPSQELRRALRVGDAEAAFNARQKLESPSSTDLSLLVEALIKAERFNEAKKTVFELLDRNETPILRIFKFFLNKVAAAGDVDTLDQISNKISIETKKLISFDNRYCMANMKAGKTDQYLTKLESDMENAKTPEEVQQIADRFPRGGAIGILELGADYVDRFEKVAEKYAARNVRAPMNLLWAQYFIDGKDDKAEAIWTKYLANEPRVMFQRVSHVAREKQDARLAQKLIAKLKDAKITEGALGNAYSCYLDILAGQEKYSDGLKVTEEAAKTVGLECINRTALLRLKDGLEKAGQKFPFTIPERTKRAAEGDDTSSSSSSSSSDDEVHQRKKE